MKATEKLVLVADVAYKRERDPSANSEIAMMVCGEQEVKIVITKETLNEWDFEGVKKCPSFDVVMEINPLAEFVKLEHIKVEEVRGRIVHTKEVLNKWNLLKDKSYSSKDSSKGSSKGSNDQTVTWLYMTKSCESLDGVGRKCDLATWSYRT
ncbi:hypothetical protein PIB30_008365 [Stylosanthes scabra]|uniref:Uncharacterized protein n=1 Tax=Stylosanthes scabra TaxID=79078 RepID=A0ABU6U3V8_9FABA|nr:hypothetical protein [Stylosanthes scabra]